MTPGRMGLIFGLVAAGAVLAAVATAFVITKLFDGDDTDDRWLTYRNDFYGYEIKYPSDWQIELSDRLEDPDSDFATQGVRITNGPELDSQGRVLAIVNFQGGWCETARVETRAITVAGVEGVEYTCFHHPTVPCSPEPDCRTIPIEFVWYFEGAKGRINYAILANTGQNHTEVDTVMAIVESFRFTD